MNNFTKGKVVKTSVIGWLWYNDEIGTLTAATALVGVWADAPTNYLIGAAVRHPAAGPIALAALVGTEEGQEEIEEFITEDYQPFVQEYIVGDIAPPEDSSLPVITYSLWVEQKKTGPKAVRMISKLSRAPRPKFFNPTPKLPFF